MTELKKDARDILSRMRKATAERFKLLVMFIVTLASLGGGGYGCYVSLESAGGQIMTFLLCAVWVWFGVAMLDLFRDMYKK